MEQSSIPSVSRILGSGVPPEALACYGRWWQLETWLREVVYVELRAKHGASWIEHLKGRAPQRAAGDGANAYMASADAGELLSYADVSDLFRLIEHQWDLFAPLLPPQRRWQGTADELQELRNRSAHCRRHHRDDLQRIEQVLRNLERGAQRFYASYLDTRPVYEGRDPLVRAWIAGKHPVADRLLEHADRQYDVRFRLSYSARPWAAMTDENVLSGTEGVLWHAAWTVGGRDLNVADLWKEIARGPSTEYLVHLLVVPGRVTATFAAVDSSSGIADAIGVIFDEILSISRESHAVSVDDWAERWTRGADRLPRRVQVMSPLTLVDPYHPDAFSIFAAG
ncbi:MAG TPA: Swt1 family HEPN domain-containing protein [Conexibacter sp.]|jgi:hypothetical protein|nr:Swt1 family HEPN domain-containing protein [Conexibacter sp.]